MPDLQPASLTLEGLLATLRGHLLSPQHVLELTVREIVLERVELLGGEPGEAQEGVIYLAPILPGSPTPVAAAGLPTVVVVSEKDLSQAEEDFQDSIVLAKAPWVSWSELFLTTSQLVEVGASHRAGQPGADSLMALAASLAEISGSSITIEDAQGKLLAYSATSHTTDDIRRQTILSRGVPEWRIMELEETGFLARLRTAEDLVIRPATESAPARVVMPVRAQSHLIGSIWATEVAESRMTEIQQVFRDASRIAAQLMIRDAWSADLEHGRQQQIIAELFTGTEEIGSAMRALRVPGDGLFCAVKWPRLEQEHRQAKARFSVRGLAENAWFLADASTEVALLQVKSSGGREEPEVQELLDQTAVGLARLHLDGPIAVSRMGEANEIRTLVREAADIFAVSSVSRGGRLNDVVMASDYRFGLALARMLRSADRETWGDITRLMQPLRDNDAKKQTQLVETLRAYCQHDGKLTDTARDLDIHSNSLRYRLARIEELIGGSLHDRNTLTALNLGLLLQELELV